MYCISCLYIIIFRNTKSQFTIRKPYSACITAEKEVFTCNSPTKITSRFVLTNGLAAHIELYYGPQNQNNFISFVTQPKWLDRLLLMLCQTTCRTMNCLQRSPRLKLLHKISQKVRQSFHLACILV